MTWLMENATSAARERAEKALGISLGMASPLWFAFGAAASVGAAWWWMTRWTKAVNLEATLAIPPAPPILAVVESVSVAKIAPAPIPEPVVEIAVAALPEPAASPEPKAAPVPRAPVTKAAAPVVEPDDLTRLVGIGPKLADALAARGVTRYVQLAAWTADDLATIDAALSLKGRAVRDAWVAQARRFAAQVN